MDQKNKTLLWVAIFALIIFGAVFAYRILMERENNAPDNIIIFDAPEEEPVTPSPQAPSEKAQQHEAPPTEPREQVPDFAFLDADGNEKRISDFFGTPIVLNFWTTWCPSCVRETPYFETLYQDYGNEIYVLKINLLDGMRETREGVDAFMAENGYTFPLFFDVDGAIEYGVQFIPVTFFICENGYAAARVQGSLRADTLQQGLDAIR